MITAEDVFRAYTGRAPSADETRSDSLRPSHAEYDRRLLADVKAAMAQLLNADGRVYNYTNAGQHTNLDRPYRNDICRAMRRAGFEGEDGI